MDQRSLLLSELSNIGEEKKVPLKKSSSFSCTPAKKHFKVNKPRRKQGDDDHHSGSKFKSSRCEDKVTRHRILSNMFCVVISYVLTQAPLVSLRSVQTSYASPHGTISMAILYTSTGLSCLAAPSILRQFSPKWTMVLSWCLYSAYFLTNLDTAHWTTAWLAAALIGITSGPLFSAQATTVSRLALLYSACTREPRDTSIARFNGVFSSAVAVSEVLGHLVTSVVLTYSPRPGGEANRAEGVASRLGSEFGALSDSRHESLGCGIHLSRQNHSSQQRMATWWSSEIEVYSRRSLVTAHVTLTLAALLITVLCLDARSALPEKGEKIPIVPML